MKNWQNVTVDPATRIIDALKVIEKSALQIALVVSGHRKLLGTVTDGDVRRAILKNIKLTDRVDRIMQKSPVTAGLEASESEVLALMKKYKIRQIPIINSSRQVVDLKVLVEMIDEKRPENPVIIMAGGLGTRLRPLTDDCPKPLLKIGDKPLLEIIIQNLHEYGFTDFYITLNYKAKMISSYFGDGSRWNVSINYIHEQKPLGTAGALSLLPETPSRPALVMNGDLLTKVNFTQLFDFHADNKSLATMCVRQYDFEVPYGVVVADKQHFVSLDEKPVQRFFVNAGIYVLNPDVFEFIPDNEPFDMTTLFNKLIEKGHPAVVFPIHEYWMDIGHISDYKVANGEYDKHF